MRIESLIILEGKNVKSNEPLIYINITESERKMIFRLISNYEYICRHIALDGTLKEVAYNNEGGEIWLTYENENVSTRIIEMLVNGDNVENTIHETYNLKNCQWDLELREELKEKDLPMIKLDDESIQIGYGVKSKIITKEMWEKGMGINIENNGLIPIIAVTGTNGKTSTVRLMHRMLLALGYNAGLSSTGAVSIGDKVIKRGDTTGFYSARMVLTDPTVDVAVLETARGGMIRKGLGYRKNKVSVITSLSEDHIGVDGIKNIEDLLKVKKLIIEELLPDGKIVIQSNYYLVKEFELKENVVLFNYYKDHYIEEHIAKGKEAWYVENGKVVYNKHGKETFLIDICDVPYTHYGKSKSNISNLLVALCSLKEIHNNLEELCDVSKIIQCDLYTNPGRQNILSIEDFSVILDYGHNEEAFKEVFGLAKNLQPTKIIGVLSAPGDREDSHIKTLGKVASEFCDEIIIKQSFDMRGRNPLEIASLIQQGALEEENKVSDISLILDECDAILHALKRAKKGEVIVLITHHLEVAVPCINSFLEGKGIEAVAKDQIFSH